MVFAYSSSYSNGAYKIKAPMITSKKQQTFVPYVPDMPSPNYPSEIECVKGKNLFDYTKLNDENTVQWKAYEDAGTMFRALPIYVGKNKQVYFSSNVPALTSGNAFYAINNINETSSNTLNVDNSRVVSSNNDGYVYLGVVTNRQYYSDVQNNTYWIMISTDDTDYLPYDTIQVKDVGKNLYKYGDISDNVSSVYYVNHKLLDNFENNTTYTISFDITSSVQPFRITIGYGDDAFQKEMINGTLPNVNNGHISFTFTTDDTTYSNLWIRAPRYTTPTTYTTTISNIMLEKGTQATTYEPYQESTLNIDLQGNELCSLPNGVKDELVVENGRVKIIKNIAKVIVTNGKFYDGQTWKGYFVSPLGKINASKDALLCDRAIANRTLTNGTMYENPANVMFVGNNTDTLDTLKAKYNGSTLYYQLETPTEIDLGEVETLSTFEGANNLLIDTNLNTTISGSYKCLQGDYGHRMFSYGDDIGFIYTDFTFPTELIGNAGDSVTTILDKIKSTLGNNYEYFYDVPGNFRFQEIKNYLNTKQATTEIKKLSNNDYLVDMAKGKRAYNLDSTLGTSYSNNPQYMNIKNDYVV